MLDCAIQFGRHRYPLSVRAGTRRDWHEFATKIVELDADKALVIADARLPTATVASVERDLQRVVETTVLRCTADDPLKRLAALDELAGMSLQNRISRRSVVIALGGGAVGNIAGLLAALLFRGIRLVHVPTTLLAMSDSVLSLKQAVNSELGKNHIGTFYPPVLVWNSLDLLTTLPPAEIQSALCEMIKNVLAICPERYTEISHQLRVDATYSDEEITSFIELCVTAKTRVMRDDPYERGDGLVLEYGHTVGHALEILTRGTTSHGFAIGMGMRVAARVAVELGMLSRADEDCHEELLQRNGAPTQTADVDPRDVLRVVALDNKRGYIPDRPGCHGMILLAGLGQAHRSGTSLITPVAEDVLLAGLDAIVPGRRRRAVDAPHGPVVPDGHEQPTIPTVSAMPLQTHPCSGARP